MTTQGAEHIINTLQNVRKALMDQPEPMLMERIQESIVLCREEIVRKQEKEKVCQAS